MREVLLFALSLFANTLMILKHELNALGRALEHITTLV